MGRPKRIMVVDDNPEMQEMIRVTLELEGYQVDTASDGMAALEMFPKTRPDLVLLDIMLPGLDGFLVLAELRRTSKIPIIMLTARGGSEKAQTLNAGAADYITKPFMTGDLLARIGLRI